MRKTGGKAILLLAGLALACSSLGCAVTGQKEVENLEGAISRMEDKKRRDMEQKSPVQKHRATYLGKQRVKIAEQRDLPDFFSKRIMVAEKPVTLCEAAGKISELSGVRIDLSSRLQKEAGTNLLQTAEEKKVAPAARMPLRFNGELKKLLDHVTSYYGAFWEWDDGRVRVFRMKTRSYDLITGLGSTEISNKISNESTMKGEGEESSDSKTVEGHQSVDHEYALDIWEKVVEEVKSMLSAEGKVVASQSTGAVTVTDTPDVHETVRSYINQANDRLSRQVAVSVKVYSFDTSDSDTFGYSLKAAFEDMEGKFGVNAEAVNTAEGLVSAAILDQPGDSGDYNSTLQQWEGSEALIEALNKRGDVKLITSGSGIVMNNQPLPIQNTSRHGYLSRSEISQGETATTTALETGSVTTGFSLNATPHILKNNEVVLQYTVTLSKLDRIKDIQSGDSRVQTPEVSSRNFMQQVRMKMGETLFLAGFQEKADEFDETRDAGGLLGWRKTGESGRRMVLVSITVNEVDA